MKAGDVIARIEAVEVALHLGEFRRAIARQRLRRLVGKPPRTLGLQPLGEVGSGGQFGSAARDIDAEGLGIARQAGVEKPAATPAAASSASGRA
jgi:hypothetical protein